MWTSHNILQDWKCPKCLENLAKAEQGGVEELLGEQEEQELEKEEFEKEEQEVEKVKGAATPRKPPARRKSGGATAEKRRRRSSGELPKVRLVSIVPFTSPLILQHPFVSAPCSLLLAPCPRRRGSPVCRPATCAASPRPPPASTAASSVSRHTPDRSAGDRLY